MKKFLLMAALVWTFAFRVFADESAAPRYAITNLTPGSKQKFHHSAAYAINNHGEVVGMAGGRAFVWRDGKLKFIGQLPKSTSSMARDINDSGQIVGTCSFGEWDEKYFLWQNGKMLDLNEAPMMFGGISINNRAQVLMDKRVTDGLRVILWQNGKKKDLGSWWASDINNAGQIVGTQLILTRQTLSQPAKRKPNRYFVWAVVWENGLAVSAAGNGSMAMLINDKRHIVIGEDARQATSLLKRKFFLLKDGQKIELIDSNSQPFYPAAINNQNQILGFVIESKEKQSVALWQDGKTRNLNDLIPATSGWVLQNAHDINERGQIVGEGKWNGLQRAFLLTPLAPTPKPQP